MKDIKKLDHRTLKRKTFLRYYCFGKYSSWFSNKENFLAKSQTLLLLLYLISNFFNRRIGLQGCVHGQADVTVFGPRIKNEVRDPLHPEDPECIWEMTVDKWLCKSCKN